MPLNIAAFNIRCFGKAKLKKKRVVNHLKNIVRRYDIILIQEIRDKSQTTIPRFCEIVNRGIGEERRYNYVQSGRLGRNNRYQEQYAFLYRRHAVQLLTTHQDIDEDDDFEREPFSVCFEDIRTEQRFFLLGIHVKPDDVEQELGALQPAFFRASDAFTEEVDDNRGVIMGDLNAGGRYLTEEEYDHLLPDWEPHFNWLLGYDDDTTVAGRGCAYDRFIVHNDLVNSVVQDSAAVFNFAEEYGLNIRQAKRVSDHFPIEFQLELGAAQG